jgi:hypothetical protein
LLEIPVTTFPWLRTPIHVSYVLYLSKFSRRLAATYFRTALWWCRCVGVAPSILLHPLDFLGCEDEPDLGFFPAMDLPAKHKLHVVEDCLTALQERFQVVTMEQHASAVAMMPGTQNLSALQGVLR